MSNNNQPLVSVVIPCYNSEKWIIEALNSVSSQSYKNTEIIIVDDGSTDGTKDIVLSYDKKIRYYYQINKGPAAARNVGIEKSKGKYVAFLDSDDLWIEHKLEKQIQFLEENDEYKLVFSNVNVVDEKGEYLYTQYNKVPNQKSKLIKSFFLGKISMNTPTIVVYKSIADEIQGFNEKLPSREDHFFLMSVANDHKMFHFKEPLVKRRINQSSLSQSVKAENVFALINPFINASIEKFPYLCKCKKRNYSFIYRWLGKNAWKENDFKKGRAHMVEAIKNDPLFFKNYLILIAIVFNIRYRQLEKIWRFLRKFPFSRIIYC